MNTFAMCMFWAGQTGALALGVWLPRGDNGKCCLEEKDGSVHVTAHHNDCKIPLIGLAAHEITPKVCNDVGMVNKIKEVFTGDGSVVFGEGALQILSERFAKKYLEEHGKQPPVLPGAPGVDPEHASAKNLERETEIQEKAMEAMGGKCCIATGKKAAGCAAPPPPEVDLIFKTTCEEKDYAHGKTPLPFCSIKIVHAGFADMINMMGGLVDKDKKEEIKDQKTASAFVKQAGEKYLHMIRSHELDLLVPQNGAEALCVALQLTTMRGLNGQDVIINPAGFDCCGYAGKESCDSNNLKKQIEESENKTSNSVAKSLTHKAPGMNQVMKLIGAFLRR